MLYHTKYSVYNNYNVAILSGKTLEYEHAAIIIYDIFFCFK